MKPAPELIDSMCLRYDHSFGCPGYLTDQQKDYLRRQMTQLWEEVAGEGFYRGPGTVKAAEQRAQALETAARRALKIMDIIYVHMISAQILIDEEKQSGEAVELLLAMEQIENLLEQED